MGKTLVHRAKMVEVEPLQGESESVFAAAFPRSMVVQGTFQVSHAGKAALLASQVGVVRISMASQRLPKVVIKTAYMCSPTVS